MTLGEVQPRHRSKQDHEVADYHRRKAEEKKRKEREEKKKP
jgi:hypothetical protein